jgi:3-oxoacyl-[acyl-carrier protein] reductase
MNWWRKLAPRRIRRKLARFFADTPPPLAVTVPYQIRVGTADRLGGQVAIVAGGSGAIGRAICCRLAAEGAMVFVGGTSAARTTAVVAEIERLGGRARPLALDVTDEGAIAAAFASVAAGEGRIDIFVNSAGGSAREAHARLVDQDTGVIDEVLAVNLRGAILCCREAAKAMLPHRRGRIVNISSVIGERGKAGFAEYAAAKAGVIGFTRSLAMELGPHGITANCVSPGIVQRGTVGADELERLRRTNWMSGYGRPEDIAGMVAYVVSDEAGFATGQNFIVDGGRSLGLKGD